MWRPYFFGAQNFCGRHPLFLAALVAVASVTTGNWSFPAAALLAAVLGLAGGWLCGWRVGLAWLACGVLAASVLTLRTELQVSAQRALVGSVTTAVQGHLLKDARGGGRFWNSQVVLLTGAQAGSKVWWEGRGEPPVAGAKVMASGNFGPLPGPRNPGEFDKAAWLQSHGVVAAFHATSLEGEVETSAWAAWAAELRRNFRTAVTAGLAEDSQEAQVIRAIVIGEQPQDAVELIDAFRNSGTLHAFSVSGLHVAMVGSIGWLLLRFCGVSRRSAVLGLLPLIFGYSWITGNSPPAVRSSWMACVFLGAFVYRRKPDLLNALGAVLLVAMLWDGRLLFQPGVQLSYGVVAAIAVGTAWASGLFSWIAKPELYLPLAMMNWRQRCWLWVRRKLAQSLAVSLVAGIGSTPLAAFHFRLFTPISVLAGVVLVPVIFLLLSIALVSVAIYPIAPPVTRLVNQANGGVAKLCVWIAQGFSAVPGGHFHLKDRRPFLLVYDLKEGAGAACFSGGSSGAVMLDCADAYNFKQRVAPSLRRLGVAPDAAVFSHPDGSHLGGGAVVWEEFPVRQALLPVTHSRSPAFRSWLKDAPVAGVRILQATDVSNLKMPDGARLEIVHTPDPAAQNIPADDRVAIYRLHWRGWKLLFTSDAGVGTETKILALKKDISADVIIAGRHAADEILSDLFLDAVNPRVIVASNASFPVEEQLDPDAVDYWQSRGIHVLDQGKSGGVTLRIDDKGSLRIEGFVDQSLLVLKPR